jgi:hypothetical protein
MNDTRYGGLPPSWTTSLREAGFSEEEISAIQAKRINLQHSHSTVLTRPSPRTTSLPRQYSTSTASASTTSLTSSQSHSHSHGSQHGPGTVHQQPLSPIVAPARQHADPASHRQQWSDASISSLDPALSHRPAPSSATQDSAVYTTDTHTHSHSPSLITAHVSHAHSPSPTLSSSVTPHAPGTQSPPLVPQQPPRRPFHITNGAPSPPPAYLSPVQPGFVFPREKQQSPASLQQQLASPAANGLMMTTTPMTPSPPYSLPENHVELSQLGDSWPPPRAQGQVSGEYKDIVSPTEAPVSPGSPADGDVSPLGVAAAATAAPRRRPPFGLASLPPRLSFHESGVWDQWAESLMSALPSSGISGDRSASGEDRFAEEQEKAARSMLPAIREGDVDGEAGEGGRWRKEREEGEDEDEDDTEDERGQVLVMKPHKPPPPALVLHGPTGHVDLEVDQETGVSGMDVTPLWREVMGMVKARKTGEDNGGQADGERSSWDRSAREDANPSEEGSRERGSLEMPIPTHSTNRDSGMSTLSTASEATVTHAVVSSVRAFATRAMAEKVRVGGEDAQGKEKTLMRTNAAKEKEKEDGRGSLLAAGSPKSARFSSGSSGSSSGLGSNSSYDHDHKTPLTEVDAGVEVDMPIEPTAALDIGWSGSASSGQSAGTKQVVVTPSIVLQPTSSEDVPPSSTGATAGPPSSTTPQYRGWMSKVLAPLREFIDDSVDPRERYVDLVEIAEGDSGSVYSARMIDADIPDIPPPSPTLTETTEMHVAIKNVRLNPSGSSKLRELQRELELLKGLKNENVLSVEGLYVDFVDDSLWVRMELMEKSLADVVCLVEAGLMMQERMIARFASDVSSSFLLFVLDSSVTHPRRMKSFFWGWNSCRITG